MGKYDKIVNKFQILIWKVNKLKILIQKGWQA